MERLRFRSTSVTDLQAELRERELLATVDRAHRNPVRRNRRVVFGLAVAWRRPRGHDVA